MNTHTSYWAYFEVNCHQVDLYLFRETPKCETKIAVFHTIQMLKEHTDMDIIIWVDISTRSSVSSWKHT